MLKNKTTRAWAIIIIFVMIFVGLFIWYYKENYRDPSIFLIPQGYVGEVVIKYNDLSSPPLPKEGKYIVYKIPKNGVLKTSTEKPQYGIAEDAFYYVDEKGNRIKKLDPVKEIHGYSTGSKEVIKEDGTKIVYPIHENFLVGTEAQLDQWRKQFKKQ
ncbi:hypothetical protein JQN58_17705 [Aneurinibacillus sp. BA2021]|nr:hypothetical protein [Aneurinibacillus sp. BA2021]